MVFPYLKPNATVLIQDLTVQKFLFIAQPNTIIPTLRYNLLSSHMNPHNTEIFFVDDDIDDRELIKESFDSLGSSCNAKTFGSGIDLIAALKKLNVKQFPSLIVLDINMPMMSGIQVLETLKQDPQFALIPVAFFTTSCSPALEKELVKKGAIACIQKASAYKELKSQMAYFEELAASYKHKGATAA
jgi:CheY-like chemotaxis protein